MRFCYSCMYQFDDILASVCPKCGAPLTWESDGSTFLKPGTVLQGKFIVGKSLGNGGFGNTYVGWNQLLQQKVAIKEYFPRQLSSRGQDGVTVTYGDGISAERFQNGLVRFLEEARSLASLQNVKGIIQIYNFFEENGTGYIVMEFLEGMDLKAILKRNHGFMSFDKSNQVILTVLHTLKQIHAYGILHRDIAPDNVFVTNEGIIKLIDFGAAKHETTDSSADAEIVLKVGYAPIEQYSNRTKQGQYTDIYEVAALFYRMITGKKPQPANERMVQDQLKAPSDLGISIPQQAEYAMMCCLNVKPEYRLQTAAEFMEALGAKNFEPVYEPEWILPPVEEVPDTPMAVIRQRFKAMPIPAKAALILAVAVVLGAGGYGISRLTAQSGAGVMAENAEQIRIPAGCVNELEETVTKKLEAQGMTTQIIYSIAEQEKEGVADGTVVDIEPKEGQTTSAEEPVKLTVATSQKVTIPDLKGKKKTQVVEALKNVLGSQYDSTMLVYYYEKNTQKDFCYDQTIETGTEASKKQLKKFHVLMSWGNKADYLKVMPALSGKTMTEAKKALEDAGIASGILHQNGKKYSNAAAGQIISQSVSAGAKVNTNTQDPIHQKRINVSISKGPKPTPKPTSKSNNSQNKTQKSKPTAAPKQKSQNSGRELDFGGGQFGF